MNNKRNSYIYRERNRKSNKSSKKKNIIVASALSLVCVAAMAGIYKMETKDKLKDESLVNWENTASSDSSDKINIIKSDYEDKSVNADSNKNAIENNFGTDSAELEKKIEEASKSLDMEQSDSMKNQDAAENVGGSANEPVVNEEENTESAQTSANNSVALSFGQNDSLSWPVEGNILLDYSMDSTVYFPTLDQYKYNPAIVIQAEVGSDVKAAASGIVSSIEKTDETGLTVTMDIGGGYKLIYGQLKNVNYSTGAYIEKGENVGSIAVPTKYYSVEGSNLFFELLNNEVPTNPIEFLRDGVVND